MPDRRFPNRAVHLDFHTMPGVYDIARDFDAAAFAQTLSDARVDYITVFAKCNLGFAYYPTDIGTVYPGLGVDMLGRMVEACHARDIQVAAYLNAGIDHEHARTRREWCRVDKAGRVFQWQEKGHYFRNPCLNTGYADYLAGMAREVLERYPVDGLFLDCFDLRPCYGHECLDAMKRLGWDPSDDAQVTEFCARVTGDFLERIEALVRDVRDGIFLYFNSAVPYRRQPTHIELEVLPTGGWGYDYLPFAIRYAATLGKPYFTMTGRFHKSWGDFGGIRTRHSLLFDCYSSLASGGTCSIGDHMHPRGRLEPEVYRLVGEVYEQVLALEPWTRGARPETDIAVVAPCLSRFPGAAGALDSVQGAARMLAELKLQFDIADGLGDLAKYRVLILPDRLPLTADLVGKLDGHLDRGGAIVSSAFAGLTEDGAAFALGAYRVACLGDQPFHPAFIEAGPEVSQGLPDMQFAVYQPGIAMRAEAGAQSLARLHAPYTSLHAWDCEHESLYCPPDRDAGLDAVVRSGNVIHFSFPLFSGYLRDAVPAHRGLLRNCLRLLYPEPLVQVEGMPSFGRVTLTATETLRLVHLLAYVPERRGEAEMIEEPIAVSDVRVAVRLDDREARRVFLAPTGEPLAFERAGGYLRFVVPRVEGYRLVVIE